MGSPLSVLHVAKMEN